MLAIAKHFQEEVVAAPVTVPTSGDAEVDTVVVSTPAPVSAQVGDGKTATFTHLTV